MDRESRVHPITKASRPPGRSPADGQTTANVDTMISLAVHELATNAGKYGSVARGATFWWGLEARAEGGPGA